MTKCLVCDNEMPAGNWKYCDRLCYKRAQLEKMLEAQID
jgi:hypothetical protein